MYSYRFAVQHSSKLFEVPSVCLVAFSDSCDQRTCNLTKYCNIVDASYSSENSLEQFPHVYLVSIHRSFHVTPHIIIYWVQIR